VNFSNKMPFDTRRINGPESSTDYRKFYKKVKSSEKKLRGSNRQKDDQHRPLVLNTGIVSKAQGSAYIEQGQTKAICAVYGPREIPRKSDFTMKGILNCTIERTPFSGSKRKAPGSRGDLEEDEMSKLLSEALEATVCMHLYPKSQIDVYVTILEDDGSALASSITVASLALADAAVQMFDTIVGISLKRLNERVLIDPTKTEEEETLPSLRSQNASSDEVNKDSGASTTDEDRGQITIGYQPSLEQIALLTSEGHMTSDHVIKDVKTLAKNSSELVRQLQLCLVESVKEGLNNDV